MNSIITRITFILSIIIFTTTTKAFAFSAEDLCFATYTRNYNSIREIVSSGVFPDQKCPAKAAWDFRHMEPSPIFILLTGLKGKDKNGLDFPVNSNIDKKEIIDLVQLMLSFGANPNFISDLTKNYKTTNFAAVLAANILGNESVPLIDLMLNLGADIHLPVHYSAAQFKCENSPIGILIKGKLDDYIKSKYVSQFKHLGAEECGL